MEKIQKKKKMLSKILKKYHIVLEIGNKQEILILIDYK